jgi:hypothetical protein
MEIAVYCLIGAVALYFVARFVMRHYFPPDT